MNALTENDTSPRIRKIASAVTRRTDHIPSRRNLRASTGSAGEDAGIAYGATIGVATMIGSSFPTVNDVHMKAIRSQRLFVMRYPTLVKQFLDVVDKQRLKEGFFERTLGDELFDSVLIGVLQQFPSESTVLTVAHNLEFRRWDTDAEKISSQLRKYLLSSVKTIQRLLMNDSILGQIIESEPSEPDDFFAQMIAAQHLEYILNADSQPV